MPLGSGDWIFHRLRLGIKLIVFFCMCRGHLGGTRAAVGESGMIDHAMAYCNGSAKR